MNAPRPARRMQPAWTDFVTHHNVCKLPIVALESVMKANAGSDSAKTCLNVSQGRRAAANHHGVRSHPLDVWTTATAPVGADAFWRSAYASLSVGRMMNVGPEPIAMTYAVRSATGMTNVLARKFAGTGAAKIPFNARQSHALESAHSKIR